MPARSSTMTPPADGEDVQAGLRRHVGEAADVFCRRERGRRNQVARRHTVGIFAEPSCRRGSAATALRGRPVSACRYFRKCSTACSSVAGLRERRSPDAAESGRGRRACDMRRCPFPPCAGRRGRASPRASCTAAGTLARASSLACWKCATDGAIAPWYASSCARPMCACITSNGGRVLRIASRRGEKNSSKGRRAASSESRAPGRSCGDPAPSRPASRILAEPLLLPPGRRRR